MQQMIEENASAPLDQQEYEHHYHELVSRYEALKQQLENKEAERQSRRSRCKKLTEFIDRLEVSEELLTSFDEGLWNATVESVTIYSESEISLKFRGGVTMDFSI